MAKKSFASSLNLQRESGKFLKKGKSMSGRKKKKLLESFLCIQSLYSELGPSNCNETQKEHLPNDNEQINDSNLLFPTQITAVSLSFTQKQNCTKLSWMQ